MRRRVANLLAVVEENVGIGTLRAHALLSNRERPPIRRDRRPQRRHDFPVFLIASFDGTRVAAVHLAWQRAAHARGLTLLDLDRVLCPNGVSDPSIRADGAHYSNEGANAVGKIVAVAAREAARRAVVAAG